MTEPGLDYEFLRYIGVNPAGQKEHQSFYLPFFAGCGKVVDLGCGDGDFIELLEEEGVTGIGVDADTVACANARERGLEIVCQDVFSYLGNVRPGSIDGVFSSHLVEHLPYEKVLELLRLSYEALKPGGVIILTTPNVRGLTAHLEQFYLHFGHVTFYHPRLLAFFLEHVGFKDVEMGENISKASPASPMFRNLPLRSVQVELPPQKGTWLRRLAQRLRLTIARVLLRPYLRLINENFLLIRNSLLRIDRPFECYVKASKQ
jgi:SAM-dependent methyltransferase